LDAEIQDAVRGLAADPAPASDDDEDEALDELRDESSQKTVEVPTSVVAEMMRGGDGGEAAPVAGELDDEPRTQARPRRRLPGGAATARVEIVPAPVESGPIGSPDLAVLLGRIFVEGLTGALTFRREGAEKTIVFLHGAPITARSNLPEDRMGEMLVRQGRLSPAQRAEAARLAAETGRRLGAVLVEMGLLKASELAPVVRRHFEEILCSLFAWPANADAAAGGGAAGDGGW